MKITPDDKIADVLQAHPALKDKLIERNPRFKALNNPIIFNSVGKFASIADVSKVSGENLDGLLALLNTAVSQTEK